MSEDSGKGDDPRKVNKKVWDENFERIFKDKREPIDFQKDRNIKRSENNE
jgi:hypothetical protein